MFGDVNVLRGRLEVFGRRFDLQRDSKVSFTGPAMKPDLNVTAAYKNEIEQRTLRRMRASADINLRNHVAATAATEHFTAIFANWTLRHPQALAGAEPRLQTLWLWHSAEESEHRSTAFDIYTAIGGKLLL